MKKLKRFQVFIAGFIEGLFGSGSKDEHKEEDDCNAADDADYHNRVETHLPPKWFSVPVQVPVDRPQIGPIIIPCTPGEGGVQGLNWYTRRLKIDEDGDVADEFLEEIVTPSRNPQQQLTMPRFEVKHVDREAKVSLAMLMGKSNIV